MVAPRPPHTVSTCPVQDRPKAGTKMDKSIAAWGDLVRGGQALTTGQARNKAKAVAPGVTLLVEIHLLPGWSARDAEICSALIGRQSSTFGEPLLPDKRTRAHWSGHLTMAQQRAGFCRLVRFDPGRQLALWNELSHADPCSHWLFWWPPSSSEQSGEEHPSACSLRRDLGPQTRDPVRRWLP